MSSRSNSPRFSLSENESSDSGDHPLGERSIEGSDSEASENSGSDRQVSEPSDNSDSDRRRGKRNRHASPVFDESSPKRRRRGGRIRKPAVDVITALPDALILHVLSFLPIKDAIKTQVLSKRWLHLWTYIPSLVFLRESDSSDTSVRDFVTFVDRTLFLCTCSKLKKLGFQFAYETDYASNVNLWTRFATGRGAEELQLDFYHYNMYEDHNNMYEDDSYLLPQLLYTNSSFKTLKFSVCKVIPKGVVCWNSLKKLSIGYAELSEDVIEKILAGSPVLEILELYAFYGFDRLHVSNASVKKLILRDVWEHEEEYPTDGYHSVLEVSAPHLHSLEISGDLCDKICRLGDISSLVDANLNFDMTLYRDRANEHIRFENTLRGLLQSLVHVKKITLGTFAIQVLSMMEAKGLRSALLNCEFLALDTSIRKSLLPGIANILESSPILETLVIIEPSSPCAEYFRPELTGLHNFDENSYWTSKRKPLKCLMLRLQEVKFISLGRYDHDCDFHLSFAQFLLKNARVLQKMVIDLEMLSRNWPKEFVRAARKLSSFARSSPNAVVLF
ncbi:F-box protein At5g03100-like [Rhododendron vialii]|uniref:F-box protein At5g03100-like n=1 Tax=Rhododendron vialii TaxID=182163 RepID=UPI00265E00A5|nr:F-box protein At5g03100-like [Rhododendron vialii]